MRAGDLEGGSFLKKSHSYIEAPSTVLEAVTSPYFGNPVFLFVLFTLYEQVILALGDFMNVQCHACIGGKSIGEDIRRLDYGVQVG